MTEFSRRGFLAAGAALMTVAAMPRRGAANAPAGLRAATRVIEVDGKAATVFGIEGPAGQGLVLAPGQRFQAQVTNALDVPTLIHWHGQTPPYEQDGVPDLPLPPLAPGQARGYDFAALPGSYWMHAHIPLQEMRHLAAPLIVHSAADLTADRQEVVMFVQDFSFRDPAEIMAGLTGGQGGGHGMSPHGMPAAATAQGGTAMDHSGMDMKMDMGGMNMGGMDMSGMSGGMAMDLNDIEWDAYLVNDRTLADPQVVRVDKGGRVLLRIINAASATTFWIDTGGIAARLVAVDGHAILPVQGSRFGLAMAQRLDLELDLPGDGAWPILALREGARERSGLILASADARVEKQELLGAEAAPAFDPDMAQEMRLTAAESLPARQADRTHMVMLGGAMQPYRWTIDGRTWGDHRALAAKSGERVEITFHNMSMMAHPMHLHGHVFQVVGINGQRVQGARRDTVHVPPNAMVTIALDAGTPGRWMLHCHHMPHLETGMMTEFAVTA